jgi:crotonobetainyl-CoA:carnitine CoA-transferase CaiB-like acyl-CoA transferase
MTPLGDITVVDLTQSVAGPVCTQLLGEMGATVIKVEPPSGDNFRNLMNGSFFTPFNHGKESVCVDLKTDRGREIVTTLAHEADVFVESFRPDVLDQYDLDYQSIYNINDNIVYCSLSGFGHEGPYCDYPGYDPCIQAMCGLMATTGYPDRPPVRIRASVIDCGTGANAAFAIMAAIRNRDRTGEGTHIDISLFDVAVSWMSYWIAEYDVTGEVPKRTGQLGIGSAPNGLFPTRDGYLYLCTMTESMYERLCSLVERPDLLKDERFQTIDDRLNHRDELRSILSEEFETYTAKDLEQRCLNARIPAGRVQTIKDVTENDPHVEERSMVVESRNPETKSSARVSALPFQFSTEIHDGGFSTAPPAKGEHTIDVLQAISYSDEEIARLCEAGVVQVANE